MQQTLEIIFINQRHDLDFVSKFRMISKQCKNISEYWLTEIMNSDYVRKLDLKPFKNIKKLDCFNLHTVKDIDHLPLHTLKAMWVFSFTDECIQKMHKTLKVLDISSTYISDKALKDMFLEELDTYDNDRITDAGIEHMLNTLHTLNINCNVKITDKSLRQMNLTELHLNDVITDLGIKHMQLKLLYFCDNNNIGNIGLKNSCQTLHFLQIHNNHLITDDALKYMTNLHELRISDVPNITNLGMQYISKSLKILIISSQININDIGIKYLNLDRLEIGDNCLITDEGIKHMQLQTLRLCYDQNFSDLGVQNMTQSLRCLHISGCRRFTDNILCLMNLEELKAMDTNITDAGIRHMKLKKLFLRDNPYITDNGIKDMYLTELVALYNTGITDAGIRHMFESLRCVIARSNDNITEEGIAHMKYCRLYKN